MPRVYTVSTENVTVSAPQDLAQIKGAAGKILRIIAAWWGATSNTLVTAQGMRTRCRFLPATVTDGSGGSTPTPQKTDPGDAAASFTSLANNTTPASTSSTAVVLIDSGNHIYAGFSVNFSRDFGFRPVIGPSESFTFELLTTVTGTVALSMGVSVEEMGG